MHLSKIRLGFLSVVTLFGVATPVASGTTVLASDPGPGCQSVTDAAMAEARGDDLETLCRAIDANTDAAFGGAWGSAA